MTAVTSIDPAQFLDEQLAQASPDLMRELLSTFINTLLSAQADAVCGAEYRTRPEERTNRRNGYRHRPLDTRVGTIDVAVPKLREGSFFPDWLLQRHSRAEKALTSVAATCYLLGVSTRRMDKAEVAMQIPSVEEVGRLLAHADSTRVWIGRGFRAYVALWPTTEDRTRAAANGLMKQALGSSAVEVEDSAGDL